MSIFWVALLLSVSFGGLSYAALDYFAGGAAVRRDRFESRLGALKSSFIVTNIEKKSLYSEINTLNDFLKQRDYAKKLQRALRIAGWKFTPGLFILSFTFFSFISAYILILKGMDPLLSFVASLVIAVGLSTIYLRFRYYQYLVKFGAHFPKALQLIRGTLSVGLGLGASLERAAKDCPYPVGVEFQEIVDAMGLGESMVQALTTLRKKIPLLDVQIFTVAISVQQETGGNLVELIRNLEGTIMARVMLRKELNALSAQARLSGLIIWVLPFVLFAAISVINPSYTKVLLENEYGHFGTAVCAVLQVIGFFWIRKISNIRIAS